MASVDIKLIKELRDRTSLSMGDCKKALEESGGDIEISIDLLKKWGVLKGKEKEHKIATEGMITTFANNSATTVGIVEVNCQTDFVSKSEDFKNLVGLLCNKMTGFSTEKFESAKIELIAKTGENIVLRRRDIFHSSPTEFSYRTWYNHPGSKLAVILEATASNQEIFGSQEFRDFTDDCAMQVAAMAPIVVGKDDIPVDMIERQRAIFEAQLTEEKKPSAAWPKIIEGKFGKWRKDIVLLEQESIKEAKKSIEQIREELSKKFGGEIKINRFVRYALGEGIEKKQENLAEEVEKLIANVKLSNT
jgi:elongation factor Ts